MSMRRLFWLATTLLFCVGLPFLISCGSDDDDAADPDDDSISDDDIDDDADDDDTGDDDETGDDDATAPLALNGVSPDRGGASAATTVDLAGSGFDDSLRVFLDGDEIADVEIVSGTQARVRFGPVALTDVGPRDVHVVRGGDQAALADAFTFYFDEDPIVFVHGYVVTASEWDVMIDRFRALGYPDDALWPIAYSSSIQSSRVNARDELAPFVDDVLAQTGAERVDIIAHSMGGLSTRLWIKSYGGGDKVRDYVSLSGTHHGTALSCLIPWLGEGSAETCPIYANEDESVNLVQWDLNGDPDTADVDETPFGVEDGGDIHWNALRTDADLIDVPADTCCLNQQFRGDCSDAVNTEVHDVGHIEMAFDPAVFELTRDFVRAHNMANP